MKSDFAFIRIVLIEKKDEKNTNVDEYECIK